MQVFYRLIQSQLVKAVKLESESKNTYFVSSGSDNCGIKGGVVFLITKYCRVYTGKFYIFEKRMCHNFQRIRQSSFFFFY